MHEQQSRFGNRDAQCKRVKKKSYAQNHTMVNELGKESFYHVLCYSQ